MNKTAKLIESELIEFSPVVIDYGDDKVVGFPNESGSSDLVIFIKEDEIIMSFAFQNAHFEKTDIKSLIMHTKKYLKSEYASVEFFKGSKDLFGGSRPYETVDFSSVDGIVNCYSMGNETAKEGLIKFLKENGEITVKAVSYDNTINKVTNVLFENGEFKVKVIR